MEACCYRSTLKGGCGSAPRRGNAMTARTSTCTASGLPLVDSRSTSFPCPECGHAIGRSRRCRLQGVPYVCTECGFQGP
ncbi:MAG: zinc finger domain-containing protein [Candidatus Thermoplasmatota archaeon]|nr:zinc finger domain-containing protein [Candidatus Thermoplasmatota archaeon]